MWNRYLPCTVGLKPTCQAWHLYFLSSLLITSRFLSAYACPPPSCCVQLSPATLRIPSPFMLVEKVGAFLWPISLFRPASICVPSFPLGCSCVQKLPGPRPTYQLLTFCFLKILIQCGIFSHVKVDIAVWKGALTGDVLQRMESCAVVKEATRS